MNEQTSPDVFGEYWYDKPGVVEHRFYGIFEGGGAKGVAYAGALRAMAEKKCWFKGVAGASAGAITAALARLGCLPKKLTIGPTVPSKRF